MGVSTEAIIRALRCCSSVPEKGQDCAGCPYYLEEIWDGHVITGCDCDQIDRDAADRLEQLMK